MTYNNITLVYEDRTAYLTLARPDKLNPLDWSTVKELKAAVAEIEARPAINFVLLTGEGRSFSAGGDLDGYIRLYQKPAEFQAFLDDFYVMLTSIERARAIWIAAVNGVCVAGGIELLLACDMGIASESAKIGDGHLNFGQLPGAGGSQRLPRAIGLLRAKHLILTGELLDAKAAEKWGLVTKVVPDAELVEAAKDWITAMAAKSAVGLAGAKRLANMTLDTPYEEGLRQEIAFVHRYATTEADATEGLLAFKEKRAPRFGQKNRTPHSVAPRKD
ncbi:MAG: enoyl-CoA hydratase/isomerase family protein [Pseudomonadota bacterium]|jgi:enoyl-CoA hydratase|uniref:enoyl-CoA hydratase/isomerase family protein n=1 Tax=Sphingobium sp. CECT 9361 TaxID=2845384 RepID=UPI001E525E3C|nr:enoyl-CoA hydratase/isomerase family protein [Sphingobium sp. CECT 9361]CAH0351257.1 putative enoyl-CoA hydratase echA8 [Sphingobium sp. CECT 9361]